MVGHAEELYREGRIDETQVSAIRAFQEADEAKANQFKEKGMEALNG